MMATNIYNAKKKERAGNRTFEGWSGVEMCVCVCVLDGGEGRKEGRKERRARGDSGSRVDQWVLCPTRVREEKKTQ